MHQIYKWMNFSFNYTWPVRYPSPCIQLNSFFILFDRIVSLILDIHTPIFTCDSVVRQNHIFVGIFWEHVAVIIDCTLHVQRALNNGNEKIVKLSCTVNLLESKTKLVVGVYYYYYHCR